MKRNKQKVTLRVRYWYEICKMLMLISGSVAVLILMIIFSEEERLLMKIIGYGLISVSLLVFIHHFLVISVQTAIISEAGITIKNFFGTIASIEWGTLASIKKERVYAYKSFLYEWLVIRTDDSQTVKEGALNKRKIAPWYIIANKRNIAIIVESFKLYRPDLYRGLFIKPDSVPHPKSKKARKRRKQEKEKLS